MFLNPNFNETKHVSSSYLNQMVTQKSHILLKIFKLSLLKIMRSLQPPWVLIVSLGNNIFSLLKKKFLEIVF